MLVHAARDTDLKDAQKTAVDKIEQQLHGEEATPRSEFKDLHSDIVAAVKAGKIDKTALEPRLAAVDKAIQDRQAKQADALNTLYAALEPAQRKAVTAAIRAKQAEREAHAAEHAADKKTDGKEADPDRAKRRLNRMTKELDLDAAQQKSVEALLQKNASSRASRHGRRA